MLISIVVPVYKLESLIEQNLMEIENVMKQTRWDFEIIAVVDGFLDKSYENAKKAESSIIKVYGYPTNRGKGYAIKYGMARAKGELIVFIDGGMEIETNNISLILEHMMWYKADIIIGSKRHPASRLSYPPTPIRRFYSLIYQLLVFCLFHLKVRDTQVGLKVFRREVLEKVLPRLVVKRYAFDIELLAVARRMGFSKIYEAPVSIEFNFSQSRFDARKLIFDEQVQAIIYDTLAVFYRMYFLKYYDDGSQRKWIYDKELDMRVNTGEQLGD